MTHPRPGIAGLAVMALVATLLVVLPSSTHPAAAATTRPAPNDPLPPCVPDGTGGEKGACNPAGAAVGISASGSFGGDGATVDVQLSPGVAICDSWPGRSTWNPSPCWDNAAISVGSPVHLNEAGDDLVGSGSIFTASGGTYSILQESLRASTWDASTTVASWCSATRSDFGTFIYGGHAQDAPWSSIGHHALKCTLTWDGDRPDNLKGATWIPIRGSLSVRTNGEGFPSPTSATTWVRVDGDMQNPGPRADFDWESAPGGVRLVNQSTHPWDLAMTYEWDLPDGTSTETSPVVELGPGLHFVHLTATDVDGKTDTEWHWVEVSADELSVTLTRDESGPVEVGDEFDVVLTVAAPPDNVGDVTGVGPDGPVLDLPPWLELADGSMPTSFDLTPGSLRQATLTLRATAAGTDTIGSRWRGTDAGGTAVAASTELPITARGTVDGEWFRLDGLGEYVRKGETAAVRLRVENLSGVPLTDLALTGRSASGFGDTPATAVLGEPSPGTEGRDEVLALPTGLDASGPGSVGFVDFDLEGVEEGDLRLSATIEATDPGGDPVSGTITADWTVRATDLAIDIAFDPPEKLQEESADPEAPPEPVEMTATVTVRNTSGGPVTDIRIEEFEITRAIGEQELWLEQVGGLRITNWDAPGILLEEPTGTDDPPEPFDLADGEEKVFTADFIARDDGDVKFHMLALGADESDATVRGYGENTWIVTPEKYLEVTTEVIIPQEGELLKAGEDVVIKGRIVNLSQTATLEVGPVIPVPSGNTGQLSLAYGGGRAPDPSELPGVPAPLELGPNDSELFEVAIATGYSDPRTNLDTGDPEVAPTGGTRAYFEFDPWAIATEADGTVRTVRTDPQSDEDRGVKLADEHRNLTVSIDDSIAIPETEWVMLAGGIGVGVVTGIARAGVGLVVGVVETLKLPYTLTVGAMEYQSRVWNSFTDEEKTLYTQEMSTYLIAMAVGNVENGLKDADQLKDDINEMVFREMTRLADEWETGDYVSAAEAYAAGGSEIAASLWLPAAMTKLAQTPRAVAALERAQAAVNARMLPILEQAGRLTLVHDALPLLRALENGAEITADAMRALYGVSPDEVAELQQLAKKYNVLLTFRSRHPSSVEWIKKFGAMMKPEAIKIKSVSELDVRLGYRDGDLGSVVFRKPDVLKLAGDGADDFTVKAIAESFIRDKGFVPGTKEYDAAKDRVALRVKEWRKHEQAYKTYDNRKSIPTEFDYEGNAIPDLRSPSSRNKHTGFKLEEVGDEEYIVKLLDPTDGKFKRVTGDIDPIAFTNLDGSPLTSAQHRDLINDMRASAKLRAQHPESATFEKGGLDFVESQFKPGEAAAQIGPEGPARAVRLNKGKSRWKNPRDYHLHWEGGYKHVGGRGKITQQGDFDPDFGRDVDVEVPEKLKFKPLELGREGETTFGRATIKGVATGTGTAVFVGEGGELIEVLPDGSTQPYEGSAALLEEGEPVTLEIAPAGQVESTLPSVQGAALSGGVIGGERYLAAADVPLTDGVVLVDDGSPMLFAPGQAVAVGVQDGQGEVRTIESVEGRTLRFTAPVGAGVDDVVVMVAPAPRPPGSRPPSSGGGAPGEGSASPPPTGADAVACPADRVPASPFGDVGEVHGADVACLAWWGVIEGVDATRFVPSRSVTRAELASLVARLLARLGIDLPDAPADVFDDDDGSVHERSINLLADLGVLAGIGSRRVAPDRPLTRGEMAVVLRRVVWAARGEQLSSSRDWFVDDDGGPFEAEINAAREAGLTRGWTATTYRPGRDVTRGQAAGFLAHLLQHLLDTRPEEAGHIPAMGT